MSEEEDKKVDQEKEEKTENNDDKKADKDEDKDDNTGRGKQKEFFKEELKRLENSLQREKTKIKPKPVKKHTPDISNNLEPYTNVFTAKYLIELPEEVQHGFVQRNTATALCDPWVDLAMDVNVLPKIESRAITTPRDGKDKKKKKSDEERPPKEGSTRLPKFPAVCISTGEYKRELNYNDVPMLREDLRKKYSAEAQSKIDQDYKRTKNDFYRMELDKMEELHPSSRPNMRSAYFAYLQNTPGSRKAVYECVKSMGGKQQNKKAVAAK